MPSFRWLHVTDLHRGMSVQGCLWPNIEKEFFADLERIHARSGPWNVIFFSGDLVQTGLRNEFKKLDETLGRFYNKLHSLGSNPVLVTVPGNHDLVRPSGDDAGLAKLGEWSVEPAVAAEFWSARDSETRTAVRRAFRNYSAWEKTHGFPRPTFTTKGELPGDSAATVECAGLRVGILGLNSAFLQLTGGDYVGKVAISTEQLRSACGEHFTDWFDQHALCFLMTHHPPTWFTAEARNACVGEIATPGRFMAHICGHLHDQLTITQSIGGAANQRLWQGPSLFGLQLYRDTLERKHGYIAGLVDVADDRGSLRLWPRLAQRHQAGHWHFVQDPSATLESDAGTPTQEITVHPVISTGSTKKDVFQVLLLSTDGDLQSARNTVAEHLRRSLGVEVAEVLKGNITKYHVVILIQGWRWEEGEAADVWKRADPLRRVAFLSDEEADWPPHRLVESSLHTQISAHRKVLTAAHKFSRPEQLPELVGAVVTERLQTFTGAQTAGLKPWERSYLEFRIPAWRSGRTALGQPHLFDPADAKELYQADLYTPLHGQSNNWQRGEDGNPVQSLPDKKKGRLGYILRRVKLAKWATVPELPHIALIGAPGGGKTIFLTRLAAAIANACLGRPIDFEPDLDVEKLRTENNLPIPVVIEATRIAQKDTSKITALLEVIADEIASAGTEKLEVTAIETSLKEGRYVLLIDALDEIADAVKRSRTLTLLKGLGGVYPRTRVLLTTRSARYTGRLKFGPELESVEVAPLDDEQIRQLCSNWSRHRKRDDEYNASLMSAVLGLADKVDQTQGDQALTENPLMLTAICMVFERYRSLPDDRGRLCDLLIDDLCRSRQSEDTERGWKLDESAKKDLLQRIALSMQEEGAQTWPFEKAIDIAVQLVPKADQSPRERARRYVDWAADHTGILRFHDTSEDDEQIRFWHRLFREYLSAHRLAEEDTTADQKVNKLWDGKRLADPFWEDVIRLLPRALGTIEKARSFRQRLELLAKENARERGRLLGLAAAAIVENRDLFPDVDCPNLSASMIKVFEAEGDSWSIPDRLLYLDAVARLDPKRGDPRLWTEKWIELRKNGAFVIHHGTAPETVDLAFSWAPTTVQEYFKFVSSPDFVTPTFWEDAPFALSSREDLRTQVRSQMRHPNRPFVQVGFYDALAFCKWRTALRSDGKVVRLPLVSEWKKLQNMPAFKNLSVSVSVREKDVIAEGLTINCAEFGLAHPSPVGTFPLKVCGAADIVGNVWEWLIPDKNITKRELRPEEDAGPPVAGGAYDVHLRGSNRLAVPPADFCETGYPSIGFRCVLASEGVDVARYITEFKEYCKRLREEVRTSRASR